MKKSVKILSAVMAVVLIFACGVGATLALLSHQTEEVVNTFAANDIIEKGTFILKEHPSVKQSDGDYEVNVNGELTTGNSYDVIPGTTLGKDPFVKATTKLDSYMFLEVTDKLAAGMSWAIDDSVWEEAVGVNGVPEGSKLYVLKANILGKTDANHVLNADAHEFNIIKNKVVTVGNDMDVSLLTASKTLTFKAYLVQAAGVDGYAAAWNNK